MKPAAGNTAEKLHDTLTACILDEAKRALELNAESDAPKSRETAVAERIVRKALTLITNQLCTLAAEDYDNEEAQAILDKHEWMGVRNIIANTDVGIDGGHAQSRYPIIPEARPQVLQCDVVRYQNKHEKWVAFVGLLDGRPYEIFTGVLDDEDGIALPKRCYSGYIVKNVDENGNKRYDFQYTNRRGYKITIEGLSERFNKEYWNYAKLISGVLRYRMPISNVIKLVRSLQLDNENINSWKVGVERALKKYC